MRQVSGISRCGVGGLVLVPEFESAALRLAECVGFFGLFSTTAEDKRYSAVQPYGTRQESLQSVSVRIELIRPQSGKKDILLVKNISRATGTEQQKLYLKILCLKKQV